MEFLHPSQLLARKAGFLYLLLVPLGVFTLLYVPELIKVPGDSAQTLANIAANEGIFRASILGAFAIQITQLFVAFALYDLLKPAGERMALYIVVFTLATMPIAMLNELSNVAVLYLINDGALTTTLGPDLVEVLVNWLLELNADGVMIAHVFWGFWLFPMGYLIAKSRIIPMWIGFLFIAASFGYVIDSVAWFAFPHLNLSVAGYVGWGEILLPLWLIFKGVNLQHRAMIASPS